MIQRDRDLYGRTVNLASRLAATAGPGEVLVTASVVRALGNGDQGFEPLEPAVVKGFAEPAPRFRVATTP